MLRNILKFGVITLGIVILGIGVLYAVQYFRYRTSPEYQAVSYFKDLEKQYAEDPYGGSTPEETLRLFIDALKKGDTDLAAKYFVLDKQEEWREDLERIKEKGLLDSMITDLERAKRGQNISDEWAQFALLDAENKDAGIVSIVLAPNHKWKIKDF